ncbi:MAG: peptidoglycan-binding protein [Betaproteobacteria bacterium]|nr:peptidoglycan-binding protein [Betaproteobacteria bacterium]
MDRIYFARGCRGALPARLQLGLATQGYYTGRVDGAFGGGTERAVLGFQADRGLARTGAVDAATWSGATSSPIPEVSERALGLTAAFEGHGYSIVAGNFDGAWLTWGIIGFTLKHGEVQKIILQAWAESPQTVRDAFGPVTAQLVDLMARNNAAELQRWANSISVPPQRYVVTEPWRSGFQRLGESPLVQRIQNQRVFDAYYTPCLATAQKYGLATELGIALAFDIHVQNGSVKPAAHRAVVAKLGQGWLAAPEPARRAAIGRAVADTALPAWRNDVRTRKLTLATGEGSVHGEAFRVANWGLGEYPAAAPPEEQAPAPRRARGTAKPRNLRATPRDKVRKPAELVQPASAAEPVQAAELPLTAVPAKTSRTRKATKPAPQST